MTQEELNEIILAEVKDEMAKETKEIAEVFNDKAKAETNLLQRMWYTIIAKLLGSFSFNIQIKHRGKVIFEYEIPKK